MKSLYCMSIPKPKSNFVNPSFLSPCNLLTQTAMSLELLLLYNIRRSSFLQHKKNFYFINFCVLNLMLFWFNNLFFYPLNYFIDNVSHILFFFTQSVLDRKRIKIQKN